MKNALILVLLGFFALPLVAFAEETFTESLQADGNDLQRAATEKMHRLEEAACTGSEMECLAKKAENRAQEASDSVKDKASELQNDMD